MKKHVIDDINDFILPTTLEIENELKREKYKSKYKKLLRSTIYVLLVVVALSVITATLFLPVLQIYGKSMEPTLVEDDIVVSVKKNNFSTGDIIAFYYNNRILVKRVIASSTDWVNIDEEGHVYVNNKLLKEPYLEELSLGSSDIEYPYQVPDEEYFVLGDDRVNSIDSRNSIIGTISKDDIIGEVIFRVWPFKRAGYIKQ